MIDKETASQIRQTLAGEASIASTLLVKKLLHINQAISADLDLPEIFGRVIEATRTLLGCAHASVVLWNPREDRFEYGASSSAVGGTVSKRVRRTGGATHWVVTHKKPIIVSDTTRDPFSANRMIGEERIEAYVGVPVCDQDNVLGVLYALFTEKRSFTQFEVSVLQYLAGLTGIAIKNAKTISTLQEYSELNDIILQIISHDLYNPLGVAKGFVSIMEEADSENAERLEWDNIVLRSLQRMEVLLNEVMTYHRMIMHADVGWNLVDINEIADQVVISFKDAAAKQHHQLLIKSTPQPLMVQGAKLLLKEMYGNLVSNALKYTPDGGTITVKTGICGHECLFSVEDTGIGIAPEDFERIFLPFKRVNTNGQSGRGLGLHLVKTLVEKHHGRITVENSPQGGSIFTIYLPQAHEATVDHD